MTRKKRIEQNLRTALLEDGPMAQALYEYELEEHVEEYLRSKLADQDSYAIAVTENADHVAILLIDENNQVHINEQAREVLKRLWRDSYRKNLQRLIPDMAAELASGHSWFAGVKVTKASSPPYRY